MPPARLGLPLPLVQLVPCAYRTESGHAGSPAATHLQAQSLRHRRNPPFPWPAWPEVPRGCAPPWHAAYQRRAASQGAMQRAAGTQARLRAPNLWLGSAAHASCQCLVHVTRPPLLLAPLGFSSPSVSAGPLQAAGSDLVAALCYCVPRQRGACRAAQEVGQTGSPGSDPCTAAVVAPPLPLSTSQCSFGMDLVMWISLLRRA